VLIAELISISQLKNRNFFHPRVLPTNPSVVLPADRTGNARVEAIPDEKCFLQLVPNVAKTRKCPLNLVRADRCIAASVLARPDPAKAKALNA
jgi:hypothetical protein